MLTKVKEFDFNSLFNHVYCQNNFLSLYKVFKFFLPLKKIEMPKFCIVGILNIKFTFILVYVREI